MILGLEAFLEKSNKRKDEIRKFCDEQFSNIGSIVLEVGCGHGHFLTSYASQYKNEMCVGVDILNSRILRGQKKQQRMRLRNLYFINIEVSEFLQGLPERIKLSTVFVLFPDPWPKTRHHKNRFIQKEFLDLLASKSEKGTKFCFRTDHEGYFEWTYKLLNQNQNWELLDQSSWPFEEETVFQKKMKSFQSLIAQRNYIELI